MKLRSYSRILKLIGCLTVLSPVLPAQTSVRLFDSLNVRPSQVGVGPLKDAKIFNTTTLNLTCPVTPSGVLASAASATPAASNAYLLVDNNIYVTNLTTVNGPTNVCPGTYNPLEPDVIPACFSFNYQQNAKNLIGQDPDSFLSTGGIAPINVSSFLTSGPQQIKIDLEDEGGDFTNSTLYLNTNCTSQGVSGPAVITGNTIPAAPTTIQLDQSFNFNTNNNQVVAFQYLLAGSLPDLTINPNGVSPQVTDSGLDPVVGYPALVQGTSFATSSCLIHNGELLGGNPVCKMFTLQCTTGNGNTASGAQCPVSTAPNEVLQDIFDGPAFTLPDFTPPHGPTFHEGMGFLMASEGWTGGPCSFDPASGLQSLFCPLNLLTDFSGPGTFTGTGQTTHPNSDFISVAQVPEDLTTVTVTNSSGTPVALGPGNWTNNPSPYFKLSSQPPIVAGTTLPHASSFVAAPIETISYGISSTLPAPTPGTTTASDTTLTNPVSCPSPSSPGSPAATTFTPGVQSLSNLTDGNYLLHYFAKDCAGTEELHFVQDPMTLAWTTTFYTFPINVDTVTPQVSSVSLSPSGPYTVGQVVTATFTCSDNASGVVLCGNRTYGTGVATTGPLTMTVPTGSSGTQTLTIPVTDAAGNTSSASLLYQVGAATVDNQISFSLSPVPVTFPASVTASVQIANINGHVPSGTVEIVEGGNVVATLTLSGGAASTSLSGIPAGNYYYTAVYLGDSYNPGGTSAQRRATVSPESVSLSVTCTASPIKSGSSFTCSAPTTIATGTTIGYETYSLDGGSPVNVALRGGTGTFTISNPSVGPHGVVVNFPGQTNYTAAGPVTVNFTVNP
jgi:hypothetical protein